MRSTLSAGFVLGLALFCVAQEASDSKPVELEVLKGSVGVWDAEFEVWAQGPDKPSMKFKGVETNTPHGEYWISSDLDSEFMGQKMTVHSIIGYDLDERKLVGTVVDQGPYKARLTGEYDDESKVVTWITAAKMPDGSPIAQKTTITQKSETERVLLLSVPGPEENTFTKFMQITFVKRK